MKRANDRTLRFGIKACLAIAALCVAALLTGCTGPRNLIGDALGYVECSEVKQEFFREYEHENIASVRETCGPNTAGCALYTDTMCEINYERGDTLTRRHECTHCVRGEFHP